MPFVGAVEAHGSEPGGSAQGDRTAEPPRNHRAISKLAAQNALHRRRAVDLARSSGVHANVPQLAGTHGALEASICLNTLVALALVRAVPPPLGHTIDNPNSRSACRPRASSPCPEGYCDSACRALEPALSWRSPALWASRR